MAVVTTKSASITNRDASPKVLNNASVLAGNMIEGIGLLEAVSGDSIGSVYILGQVPSNARVSQVLLSCDAITTCAGDIGLYDNTEDGSAVIDADFFASAQSLASALANSDVTHESAVYGIEDAEKPLWEALGLSADPNKIYDIAITLTAAAGSAGTVGVKVKYAI